MNAGANDLSNKSLIAIVALALLASLFATVVILALPGDWGAPGGPILQAAAAIGSLLLLASFGAVLAKRRGADGKAGFRRHVWLASIGAALVFAHAASNLGRPPALLLLALMGLICLGVWSRTHGARLAAATFGQKHGGFQPIDPKLKGRLAAILVEKRAALASIDASADEATFALSPRHWRSAPMRSLRYFQLAKEEERLTGARAGLPPAQALWRMAHRLIAWGFVLGLVAHIVIVMAFAGYAADGRDIYWLHLFDWDF